MLLKLYTGKIVRLHADAPPIAAGVGERPVSSPLARYQLRERDTVTNLQHENVQVDSVVKHFLQLMAGSRDRPALLSEMERLAASKEVTVEQNGQAVRDAAEAQNILAKGMERNLERLARLALLVA